MTPEISSRTTFRAHPLPQGRELTDKAAGRHLTLGYQADGVTLRGDGFDHTISVKDSQVSVSRTGATRPEATFPKLPYQTDSRRVALGVAAVLTGLPVNLLSGEKPEPVYTNLAGRGGVHGGRYRIQAMERDPQAYTVHILDNLVMRTNGEHSPEAPSTNYATRSGQPIGLASAFRRMTGTDFAEAFQGSVAELWRSAGKPGTPGEAAQVAHYVFDQAYKFDATYDIYQPTPQGHDLEWALQGTNDDPGHTWGILSSAAAHHSSASTLLRKLS